MTQIKKINSLTNFGIFQDFSWNASLKDFNRFNLIYGWNRNGKTTLSRVFASCEKKSILDAKFQQYPDHGEFEITTSDDKTVSSLDVQNTELQIKVFNQDFIEENISFDPTESCNPIVHVSKVDIIKKEELKKLQSLDITLRTKQKQANKTFCSAKQVQDTFLTALGREIANSVFDKNYNRRKVENKIEEVGVDNFEALSEDELRKYQSISRSEVCDREHINSFSAYVLNNFEDLVINDFIQIYNLTENILNKEIISETLNRLKEDSDLNNWVKQGLDLQRIKNENETCLFCQNKLDDRFLSSLSKHFSSDYDELQNQINKIKQYLSDIKLPEINNMSHQLYPDLQISYSSKLKELNQIIFTMKSWITEASSQLDQKYNQPLEIVSAPELPTNFTSQYNLIVKELNQIIDQHNDKLKNHSREVSEARKKIEINSIAIAIQEQDYKKIVVEVQEAHKQEGAAKQALINNQSKINKLEAETSNISSALPKINKHLGEFFGRNDLQLTPADDHQGYLILRENKPAKNLSESEKTAIAFSYFVVKTEENDMKISNSIIFIDDPISSFDVNSVYHCFSMIKQHFKHAKQLFISTHNFQFFNLIKKWFKGKNENIRKNKEESCNFYMVKSIINKGNRVSNLSTLENTLENFRSEYNYLFKLLSDFIKSDNPHYKDLYTIGNIARRFFDIFSDFKIPGPDKLGQKQRLEKIVKEINKGKEINIISETEADKVFLLINGFSHNDDPLSVVEHIDRSECLVAIKNLIKIIEYSDPLHYKYLNSSIEVNSVDQELQPV